jgi:hypothetical protein
MRTLADVRRDVVRTIRQVVDVVSHYAGGALPEPARARVRSVILGLPGRWASAVGAVGIPVPATAAAAASASASLPSSPRGRKEAHRRDSGSGAGTSESEGEERGGTSASPSRMSVPGQEQAMYAAQRVLMLATEGLDMMRGVTGVVKESLDRAETWVGRMRAVGVMRSESEEASGDGDAEMTPLQRQEQEQEQAQEQEHEDHERKKFEKDEDGSIRLDGDMVDLRTHVRMSTGRSVSSSSTSSSSLMTEEECSPPGTPTESSTAVTVMSLESLVNGKGGEGREIKVSGGEMELDR